MSYIYGQEERIRVLDYLWKENLDKMYVNYQG